MKIPRITGGLKNLLSKTLRARPAGSVKSSSLRSQQIRINAVGSAGGMGTHGAIVPGATRNVPKSMKPSTSGSLSKLMRRGK